MSRLAFAAALVLATDSATHAQGGAAQAPPAIPVMDGGAGKCSLELTVAGEDGKPVNAADVKVHVEYGFVGIGRLDLEAYTNADGKLRFTGLPRKMRRPPLEFRATKDQLTGIAVYDPATECEGKHDLVLHKQSPTP